MSKEKRYIVYVHTNKYNGKKYVGITCQPFHRRCRNGKGYVQSPHFYSAIQKFGWDGFEHEIIAEDLSELDAQEMEKKLIKEWKTDNNEFGYNITPGGETHKWSEEGRQSFHEKMSGANHPNYGHPCPEELKQKFSLMFAGENGPFYGHTHTDEARKKIGDAHRGTKWTDEQKQNLSRVMKGKLKGREKPVGSGRKPKSVLCIETNKIYETITSAAKAEHLSRYNITLAARGDIPTCGGYHWKYCESSVS